MPTWITALISGVWGYVAAAGVAALLSVGVTHELDALGYGHTIDGLNVTIATMKTQVANNNAISVSQSLAKLQSFITQMQSADADYNASLAGINSRFQSIETEFKSATKTPLPIDCKPDAGRLRNLSDAVAAANASGPSSTASK